jgi:hypothetical protein
MNDNGSLKLYTYNAHVLLENWSANIVALIQKTHGIFMFAILKLYSKHLPLKLEEIQRLLALVVMQSK